MKQTRHDRVRVFLATHKTKKLHTRKKIPDALRSPSSRTNQLSLTRVCEGLSSRIRFSNPGLVSEIVIFFVAAAGAGTVTCAGSWERSETAANTNTQPGVTHLSEKCFVCTGIPSSLGLYLIS